VIFKNFLFLFLISYIFLITGCAQTDTTEAKASTSKTITAFGFSAPAATGVINESNHTIAVTVPYATDVTALAATFTVTGSSVKIGSTVQVSGITTNDFTGVKTYNITAADSSTQNYTITVTIALNSAKEVTGFTFPASTGTTITEASHTIAVTVSYNTVVTALVAAFTTTGSSVKIGSTAQVSGTTANNFTGSQTYTVTAADSSTQNYTVTVTVALNPAKAITVFYFAVPAAKGVVNEGAKTAAINVWGSAVSQTPTITHTGASISPASGVTQDFSSPKTYTVTAADGTTQDYVVTVTIKEYALREVGPAGGLIFYINPSPTTWKYLEAAPAAGEQNYSWCKGGVAGYGVSGASGIAVGTGLNNTSIIIAYYTTPYAWYAAGITKDYNGGGYTDWFLPSRDELGAIYSNLKVSGVGSFNGDYYWSSTEFGSGSSYVQEFATGIWYEMMKNYMVYFRPIRAF
jgi:hypothetical protein